MSPADVYLLPVGSDPVVPDQLRKNTWLVVLHASRIPPHIGLLIQGHYHSLTIKGHELDVSPEALFKTIQQRKIPSLFIHMVEHPVFSYDYQNEIFRQQIGQFEAVKQDVATCLSPVKLFFQEFYALPLKADELFFEFLQRLQENKFVQTILGLNLALKSDTSVFGLPVYTQEELQDRIRNERSAYYRD